MTIQSKSGKCLKEEPEILIRWIEYCSVIYYYGTVLDCLKIPDESKSNSEDWEVSWSYQHNEKTLYLVDVCNKISKTEKMANRFD